MPTTRRLQVLALLAAAVIVGAGCGASATPAPTPTPAPTAAPTPTPVDVAAAFLAELAAAESGRLPFTGQATIGEAEATLAGTLELAGSDTTSTFTFDLGGVWTTQEAVRIGTKRWAREDDGPWVLDPEPADPAKTASAYLATLTSVEETGVETKGSKELHHLVPPASQALTPEMFGLDPSIEDASVTVDFWAEEDGTPAVWTLGASWTQGSGASAVPIKMTMDVDLSGLGAAVTIQPPTDAWTGFTSTRFDYSMAYAPGWSVSEEDGTDVYSLEGQPYIYVAHQDLEGDYSLDRFHDEIVAYYKEKDIGAAPDADEAYSLDGVPARVLTYHFTNASDVKVFVVDAITAREGTGWEVYLAQEQVEEESSRAFFDTMVSTFSFEP